jgi:hypothetical protein
MRKQKKPTPIFEVVFTGGDVYPERMPINKVTNALAAIKRLTAGEALGAEDEEDEEGADEQVRLLDVTRTSSAVFRFLAPSPTVTINRIKDAGRVLGNPDDIGNSEYVLRPIKDLSAIASSLNCSVVLREADKDHDVLARIEPDSYAKISKSLLVSGNTKISGVVQRIGGITGTRCALSVPFQNRLLYCKVETEEVARKLGVYLYQRVIAAGKARWLKGSMRLFSFAIQDVSQTAPGSIKEHLLALWEAGLNDWELAEDPDGQLQQIRGNE